MIWLRLPGPPGLCLAVGAILFFLVERGTGQERSSLSLQAPGAMLAPSLIPVLPAWAMEVSLLGV